MTAASSNLIPPMPSGVIPGSGYWNDWIEKLRTIINNFADGIPFSSITNKPTTVSGYGITDAAVLTSGRTTNGVKTTDDVIIDNSAKGLVLKSPNGHYWLVSVSNAGTLSQTDLGTTSP